jgi:hypothetical protein
MVAANPCRWDGPYIPVFACGVEGNTVSVNGPKIRGETDDCECAKLFD